MGTERMEQGLALVARIRSLEATGDRDAWEVGRLYNRIASERLWDVSRFAEVDGFLASELPDIAPATLALYGRLARQFDERVVARHGAAKLAYLLSYESLFHGEVATGVDPADIEIRVPENSGPVQLRRFRDVDVNDLRNAIRRLKGARDSRAISAVSVTPAAGRLKKVPEDSLLGLLALVLGLFAVVLDVERGGYVVYLGSIPVRAIQLGVAMVVLGADFFLRRSGLLGRLSGRRATQPCR